MNTALIAKEIQRHFKAMGLTIDNRLSIEENPDKVKTNIQIRDALTGSVYSIDVTEFKSKVRNIDNDIDNENIRMAEERMINLANKLLRNWKPEGGI